MKQRQAKRPVKFIDRENIGEYAVQRLERAAAHSADGFVEREFRLPFLRVRGLFSDGSFVRLCEEGLATRPSSAEPTEQEIQIHVTHAADGTGDELAEWREPSFSPAVMERIITGQRLRGYYNHEARFWQFYDPATRRGLQSMSAANGYPPWESSSPLRAFLHWAYDEQGKRLAHAATLGIDGRGALLAGSGGAGKSGTTLAGIAHGLSSVGDDYVLLDNASTRRAHAVFSKMKQDIAGLKRVGVNPFELKCGGLNWQDKLEFHPGKVRGGAFTESLEIAAILLPKIAHLARTTIRPARQADAMLALAPSGLFQMPGCAASGVRFFAQLVRDIPAFELHLSENPREIAETIRDFLGQRGSAHVG